MRKSIHEQIDNLERREKEWTARLKRAVTTLGKIKAKQSRLMKKMSLVYEQKTKGENKRHFDFN